MNTNEVNFPINMHDILKANAFDTKERECVWAKSKSLFLLSTHYWHILTSPLWGRVYAEMRISMRG